MANDIAFTKLTAEHKHAATQALIVKAAKAKRDPKEFLSFVMHDEKTQRKLTCAPHQRVIFDFVMAHERSILRLPVGCSKTFSMATLTLWLLGQDVTVRGAIVSATKEQAQKVLTLVRDTIELNPWLKLVFPELERSPRLQDPWTQEKITVKRPPGIRDPSLVAIGLDGALPGARLAWCIVDDVLDMENTNTPSGRQKVLDFLTSTVFSRLDPTGARLVVANTPWHPDDCTYTLEKQGMPTLTMDVLGNINIANADKFDTDDIRGSTRPGEWYRLSAHDPDPHEETLLWPARITAEYIERVRQENLTTPHRFNQLYLCQCRDEETARCKSEWIEQCKKRGLTMVSEYHGPNPTVTGLDLAVGETDAHDMTAFFSFEMLPNGKRRILDIEMGHFNGPTIRDKLIKKARAYNSIVRVETNACFTPETKVLTKDGYKPIGEVRVGDEVWTHAARWRSVKEVLGGHANVMTRVRTRGGIEVRCTPNHWFWMKQAGRTRGRKGGHHRPVGEPDWVSVGFEQSPSYCAIAKPRWPESSPELQLRATRRSQARTVSVGDDAAIALGLFMAEGHATKGQVEWTLARREEHLAEHVADFARVAGASVHVVEGDGTLKVIASSTALAEELTRFGNKRTKRPPMEWWGWPLETRLAMVRGWLLGDGCLLVNNKHTRPHKFFSGCSISRDWMLFARTTLLEYGLRPNVTLETRRVGPQYFQKRIVQRSPIYMLRLNAEDSAVLRASMTSHVEESHWPSLKWGGRRGHASLVNDGEVAWAWLRMPDERFEKYDGPVFNLVVDEDESFVVEDMVVHNAQMFIRQFALAKDASIPVKAHQTSRANKHSILFGVESLFVELQNGGWEIPCDDFGRPPLMVQKWIDACVRYEPNAKHVEDVLMACWLAREQARQLGFNFGSPQSPGPTMRQSLASGIMSR